MTQTEDDLQWKKGLETARRDIPRKAETHLELNLARDVKDNKKGFFKWSLAKGKPGENVRLLLNEVGALIMEDTEKTEVLSTLFSSVLLQRLPFRNPRRGK